MDVGRFVCGADYAFLETVTLYFYSTWQGIYFAFFVDDFAFIVSIEFNDSQALMKIVCIRVRANLLVRIIVEKVVYAFVAIF